MSISEDFYQRSQDIYAGSVPDRVTVPSRYQAAADYLRNAQPARVVELGFGLSSPIIEMCRHVGSMDVIDIVPDLLDGLPKNCRGHVENLDNPLPFANGEIDCVLAMMIFEHLYNPFQSFSELARILKPGGIAFVNLPNVASIKTEPR